MRPVRKIILHASQHAGDTCAIIDARHRRRGLRKIGFHYVIRENGKIEKGRKLAEAGAHCLGYNADSIGICLCGEGQLTTIQHQRLIALLTKLRKKFPRAELFTVGQLDRWENDPLKINAETLKAETLKPTSISLRFSGGTKEGSCLRWVRQMLGSALSPPLPPYRG